MGNATSGKAFFYFTVLSDSLAVGVKAPMDRICKALGITLSQKVQRGELLWERGVNYPPYFPITCLVLERLTKGVCVCWLCHCMPCGIALFVTAEGMRAALCLESSGQLVSSSHERPLPGAQSGSGAPSREQTNIKTRYQRVRARQDLGPGPKSPSGHTDLLGKIAIELVITLYGVPQIMTWGTNL